MMNWEINPFIGIGVLTFGMLRKEVHSHIGSNFTTFLRYGTVSVTEAFSELGLHLDYDSDERLTFIETFPPCVPTYRGVYFFDRDIQLVLANLQDLGYQSTYEHQGYTFETLSFVLYVPFEKIEAVSVYSKGYYEA